MNKFEEFLPQNNFVSVTPKNEAVLSFIAELHRLLSPFNDMALLIALN